MYDFQPGTPEVANNAGAAGGASFAGAGALYYDADGVAFNNDVTELRYFGYHINSGASCSTQSAFSRSDPQSQYLSRRANANTLS